MRNLGINKHAKNIISLSIDMQFFYVYTLQATRCGQSLPKPSGGEIFLNNVNNIKMFGTSS